MISPLPNTVDHAPCHGEGTRVRRGGLPQIPRVCYFPVKQMQQALACSDAAQVWLLGTPGSHTWPFNHWILPKPGYEPHLSCGAQDPGHILQSIFLGWVPGH